MRGASVVEQHLLAEAAAVERFTARVRLAGVAVLAPVGLASLAASGAAPSFLVPATAISAALLLLALVVDRIVWSSRYRTWFPYATVALDVGFVVASTLAPPDGYRLALKTPLGVAPYFAIVAIAALRQSPRLSIFAGVLCSAAYSAMIIPLALQAPHLIVSGAALEDLDTAVVGVSRLPPTAILLLLAGVVAALGASRTRRLVAHALDTVTFLFADLRDYTPFLESHGDTAGAALVAEYRRIVRAEIARTGGREVKTEGDSFLVAFGSAHQAVDCAVGILRAGAGNRKRDVPLDIGIGINAGEPVIQDGDYVGLAVNVAARLGQQARAGELLVSELVRGLTRSSSAFPMERREGLVLKGIADPPTVYALDWQASDSR